MPKHNSTPITTTRKIHQIIPADGFHAVYRSEEGPFYVRLACWALTDEGVEGIDPAYPTSLCEDNSNFQGYLHESEIST